MNAVIFDMDGVLVDSERVVWESFRYAGEKTGVPDVERMAIIGLGLNDEAWIKRFRQEFGADSDRILEHEEAYLQNFYANGAAPAKKGAQRLLEQLCAWNIPVAVASSSPAAVVRGQARTGRTAAIFYCGHFRRHGRPLEAGAGHFPRGGAAAGKPRCAVHRDRGFAERPGREQARRMPDAVRAGPLAAGGGAPGAL